MTFPEVIKRIQFDSHRHAKRKDWDKSIFIKNNLFYQKDFRLYGYQPSISDILADDWQEYNPQTNEVVCE